MEERVQKILARAGYGSRRQCETLILQGRVKVNGAVIGLGAKADPERDKILVDDQPVSVRVPPIYIALNKPRGVVSAAYSPEGRKTVCDLVDIDTRLFPVGRLDIESEGLILLTNDGELANRISHPRYGHEKEYRVFVAKRPDEEQLKAWRRGIVLSDGYRTQPAEVWLETTTPKGAWLGVILREGRKRQIREMGALTGLPVLRIIRVRIGAVRLGNLKPGQWRYLTPQEVEKLRHTPQERRPSIPPRKIRKQTS
ncbi:MAG: pseudouridine synthase [Anaerolineales bacterium]|nr:rRNA pseudouridine synthase [Anaerolineales bacterium]MCS7246820.1 rRNA pseudouridine synthase [Anaerolineales bacterium]MDW8160630.1 pseudouridine synthase [Anaerolineales bacterium]MDW8447153.1 pseudouridine synthase [Anaerolineales bacterium]